MINGVISHHKAAGVIPTRIAATFELDDVTPLHRAKLVPAFPAESPEEDQSDKAHKMSRYSTLPKNVDEALGLISRELELACQNKAAFGEMKRKVEIMEQELQIQRGKTELLERDRQRSEVVEGTDVDLRGENRRLREENVVLNAEMRAKTQEWERWRVSMKAFVDGK